MSEDYVVVTCEHAGNDVPREYAHLWKNRRVLNSHRGFDPGAREFARGLAEQLEAPLFEARTSRLLVDLNRSVGHPRVFSEFSQVLAPAEREALLQRHYHPYRRRVESAIAMHVDRGQRVWHVSVHTFAARLRGAVRNADVGLLYDPARLPERDLCLRWQAHLRETAPRLRVRRNYPYRGTADGFTTYLRRVFPAALYAGIELEINQRWKRLSPAARSAWREHVAASLQQALTHFRGAASSRNSGSGKNR